MQKGRILLSFFIVLWILISLLYVNSIYAKPSPTFSPTIRITPSPTITPTITPIPTSTPTLTPTPTTIQSGPTSTVTPAPSTTTSIPDYILSQVNEYRKSKGLGSVSSNNETCAFALIRVKEISSLETFNHDGFTSRVNNKTLPYPSYHEVTENIAYNTDYKDVVPKWTASPGHEENMRKDTLYVCIGKYGDYYTYEGWRP